MNSGLISRHENKGNISYKDPESCPRGGNSKGLKLSPSCDLTKVLVAKKNQMLNNYWDLLGLCRDNNWMGPILDKLIINFK